MKLIIWLVALVAIGIFHSCNRERGNKFSSKYKEPVKKNETLLDTLCYKDNNLSQCYVVASQKLNDSLLNELGKNELANYNFINSDEKLPINFLRSENLIKFDIYFLSCKNFIQKIIVTRQKKDTLFLGMKLMQKGKNEDMWFHKINLSYLDTANKIRHVFYKE